ncbi:FxSxx-COOH system tetratricopeptide repeat protein [Catenuloplanes atrovinosus]|uniref:Tetratricopeptide (TPR) repeat protein n=1 Tax=Catenuloplanes atrovinosus TaxID=137266 RepID=A0AAE3YRI6_9ACTN|nr:FxSxx-COOH system tetratricopeptide repeat protein [Catenuloplanes atrovinosus]MDR7277912.1 tetratricopeptide (TPR) repeat protein [Catenuloplanes atrovinosus]
MAGERSGLDFFISYASENRGWAAWISVQLEGAGYSTRYQAADFRPGRDFVHEMQAAIVDAERTIAVLSPAYLVSEFGESEWRAAFARDPTGELGVLIPVLVQPCEPPGLLASRVYVDLTEVGEVGARRKLLAAVDTDRPRPASAPYPGRGGVPRPVRFPGAGPEVANLPQRNLLFTGRESVVRQVYEGLRSPGPAAVVSGALHGLGGVGKTTLAVEYAYRFRSDYDVMWWIDAEQPATVAGQLAALGRELGLTVPVDDPDVVAAVFGRLQSSDRWLLIFDNAEQPSSLAGLIPAGGGGHVLVTSRWPDWRGKARTVQVGVWSRAESVAFLRSRTRHDDERLLSELAELVGDLPLAVEEAAAYLEQTGEDLAVYVRLVRDHAREIFTPAPADHGAGTPRDADRRRVATVWSLSLERVHTTQPLAEQLLTLLAFLAPQVPRGLVAEAPDLLPPELGVVVSDRLAYNRLLEAAGRYALIELTPAHTEMHRLVQTVVQARLDPAEEARWAGVATTLVRALFPDDSWEVERWDDCQRLLPQVLAVAEHAERLHVGEDDAGFLLHRASAYLRESGQYRQAEPLARRALHLTSAASGPEHPDTAWRHDELGRVLQDLGRLDEAHTQFEQALAIGLAALGPDHPDIGIWRGGLGRVLRALGRLDEAHTQYEQALTIGLAALGPDHPEIGIRRSNLGNVLQDLGRLDEAHTQLEQALTISLAALGPDHPDIGIRRNNLGSVLQDLGRLDEAHTQLEQALTIGLAALGPDHPDIGIWRGNLGGVLRALGRLDEAHTQYEQALTISLAALGPDHPDIGIRRNNLGSVLQSLGRLDEAHTQYEQALTISLAALGPNHPDIGIWRNNFGSVLQALGRLDEARTQYEQALTISLAALGPDHPQTTTIRANLTRLDDHRHQATQPPEPPRGADSE